MTTRRFENLVEAFARSVPDSPPSGCATVIGYFKTCLGRQCNSQEIRELYIQTSYEDTISKAENILFSMTRYEQSLVILNGVKYLAAYGILVRLKPNTTPDRILILNHKVLSPVGRIYFTLFDGSILENQNDPVERFILRKLIPCYSKQGYKYGFASLSNMLIIPQPPLGIISTENIKPDLAMLYNQLTPEL